MAPNVVVHSSVMNACSNSLQWERAVDILVRVQDAMLEHGASTNNAIVRALERLQKWSLALGIIIDMRHHGIQPNATSFHALAKSCDKDAKVCLSHLAWKMLQCSARRALIDGCFIPSARSDNQFCP